MKRYFKHKITGKIEQMPERYGRLFGDVLEPVEDPGKCLDCGPKPVEVEPEEDYTVNIPEEEYAYEKEED